MALLDERELDAALASLPGWVCRGQAIEKQFALPSYADAVAAVVRLAFDAEAADHHPDVTLSYRRVTVCYCTHSEGGLTIKDLEGARLAERVFGPFTTR
jgi:4a-hydroxytetrahydrobiopterin dehydratase